MAVRHTKIHKSTAHAEDLFNNKSRALIFLCKIIYFMFSNGFYGSVNLHYVIHFQHFFVNNSIIHIYQFSHLELSGKIEFSTNVQIRFTYLNTYEKGK